MKRISMWSGPRNISTACMYSFHHRRDCHVVDEPFYAYYLHRTGLDHPCRAEILSRLEQDADKVVSELLASQHDSPILFMKNMPHHMVGLNLSFVKQFENFFLIREPREMILSYIKKIPQPKMSDLGLDLLYDLFQSLRAEGQEPEVVDSFALLSNPRQVLTDLCLRLGIDYSDRMISWPAGAISQDGAWAQYWYANVHTSTGFGPAIKREISDFPKSLEGLAQECEGFYHEMKKFSL